MSQKTARYPLRINVGFLLNQPVGTHRDINIELEKLDLSPDFDVSDFSTVLRVSRTSRGILVQTSIAAFVQVQCVRCLDDFNQKLEVTFSELFAFKYEDVTDSELVLPENGFIDIAPLAHDYLMVEIPISPLCSQDCKGLCTICGENLNTVVCEHQVEVAEGNPPD